MLKRRSPIPRFAARSPALSPTDRSFAGETATPARRSSLSWTPPSLLAKVHLAQSIAQRLKVGDEASVTINGVDEPVPAKVYLISPALDPGSTTVEVWVRVDNKAGAYKAGTPAKVAITTRTVPKPSKSRSPPSSPAQDGAKSVMVITADSTAHKIPVQLGINDGEDVQVTQGLTARRPSSPPAPTASMKAPR